MKAPDAARDLLERIRKLAYWDIADDLNALRSRLACIGVAATVGPPTRIITMAVEFAGLSPCRSKRGVVIFKGERIVSEAYNYKPSGFECDGSLDCKATCRVEAVHAEQQAIMAGAQSCGGADLLHAKVIDGALVASGGPSCIECSKLILAAGIAGVWLYHETGWKRYEAAEFHALSLKAGGAR